MRKIFFRYCELMNFMQKYPLLVLAVLGVCVLVSCSSEPSQKPIEGAPNYVRKENQPAFSVPSPYSAMRNAVQRIDMNRDGYDDAVLTVMGDTRATDVADRFDTAFVYQYNAASQGFEQKYKVPVYFGSAVDILDVDGDEFPEVLLYTDAGGNDAIVSNGLTIVQYKGGAYNTLLTLDGGVPEVLSVDVAGQPVVVVKVFNEYWPDELSHAESVSYIDSLLIFRSLSDSAQSSVTQTLFQQALTDAEQDYTHAKNVYAEQQDDEAAFDVYSAAVRMIKYYGRLGMGQKVSELRTKEWKFWRGCMPEGQLNVLKQLTSSKASS